MRPADNGDADGIARRVHTLLCGYGLNLRQVARAACGLPLFIRDSVRYAHSGCPQGFELSSKHLLPVLTDYSSQAGNACGDYFHQDLWAARRIYSKMPSRHVDVGSRIDGFISHLLVFMPVEVVDIRPLSSPVRGLTFVQADATLLDAYEDGSISSLSSLHAAEHFGLGRYSDPVDPFAHQKFMRSLDRVLAVGGHLYFSVPIGKSRLCFNAHRVFDPSYIVHAFEALELTSFAYVDLRGRLHDAENWQELSAGCVEGLGLFEFRKPELQPAKSTDSQ